LQLDLGLTSGMQLSQISKLSALAQEMGIETVWVGDDLTRENEVFTLASSILLKHGKMNVGIGVTSPLARNITTIARASLTLAQIGGDNRFRLGLGVGGLQDLKKLGVTFRNPASMLTNASNLVRDIWKGETLTSEADPFKLNRYHSSVKSRQGVPILFGVRGPKLLALAGEVADGVILSGPKTYLTKARNLVRNRLSKRQRSSRDFAYVIWIPTIVTEKPSDLKLVKRTVAFVLSDTPKNVLEMADLDSETVEKITIARQRRDVTYAARLIDDYLLNEVAIHGDAKQVCEKLKTFERLGVQEVVFGPPYGVRPHIAMAKIAKSWRDCA
jgi:5,10-methylenetetrahydromethanopterin reductase